MEPPQRSGVRVGQLNPRWFTDLTGLASDSPDAVRAGMMVDGRDLVIRTTGARLHAGVLTLPCLGDLTADPVPGRLRLREVVADVAALHADPAQAGSVFQVASQTNLLEMTGPGVTPEDGIARYAHDHTQGPACAMACAAGTIWRNYFVPVGGRTGQDRQHQIDTLADLAAALGPGLWTVRNGYVQADGPGLARVAALLAGQDRDRLRGLVRIGLQRDTEVTASATRHRVTQLYCSALPVAYGSRPAAEWEPFARLVLEAAYAASFAAALYVAAQTGVRRLFLTRLGGGAFGNPDVWITDAILHAATRFQGQDLDVALVSYGGPNPANRPLLDRLG